jgi:hypothetical protein
MAKAVPFQHRVFDSLLSLKQLQLPPAYFAASLPGALGNLLEALDDRARFTCQPGEFDVADRSCAAQREADHFSRGDVADTGRGDGNSLPGSNQAQDGEPVRCFLNNLRPKAMLLTQRQGLLVGSSTRTAGIVDEWLVAKHGDRDTFLVRSGMSRREHGNERL